VALLLNFFKKSLHLKMACQISASIDMGVNKTLTKTAYSGIAIKLGTDQAGNYLTKASWPQQSVPYAKDISSILYKRNKIEYSNHGNTVQQPKTHSFDCTTIPTISTLNVSNYS